MRTHREKHIGESIAVKGSHVMVAATKSVLLDLHFEVAGHFKIYKVLRLLWNPCSRFIKCCACSI